MDNNSCLPRPTILTIGKGHLEYATYIPQVNVVLIIILAK